MRLKFHFVPQSLKNLKPLIQILSKLVQSQTLLPRVYLCYFTKIRSLRFLIDSQRNPIIISLSQQMLTNEDHCQFRAGKQLVTMEFENTKNFFDYLLTILNMDDKDGIELEHIKVDQSNKNSRKFVKLSFRNDPTYHCKLLTDAPKYDVDSINFHPWISGCNQQNKMMQFSIITQQLVTMMRYMSKTKSSPGTKLMWTINMVSKLYTARSSDIQCLPNCQGQLRYSQKPSQLKMLGYQIGLSSLKTVMQMLKKIKEIKIYIMQNTYQLVFAYIKDDLYVTHVNMAQWIKINMYQNGQEVVTKIQAEDQGMYWN